MNLSPGWVGFLRGEGFEATHWSEVGDPRAPDPTIMAWARDHGGVVVTQDVGFSVLVALAHRTGPSVVLLRAQDVFPVAIGSTLVRVLREQADQLERGAIVTLDEAGARVRILPIGTGREPG